MLIGLMNQITKMILYNLRGLIAEKLLGLALMVYHPKDLRKLHLAQWILKEAELEDIFL